jgi:hypothetical protein
MEDERRPPWLVRQENGAVAEARTRAFLMDRFWVLERSVDVEGADFIIQRRLTTQSLLDRTPPRLGFIQAKFYANDSTTQYIHREYVLDAKAVPRSEFFAICHTGREDNLRMFLLSADEIAKNCRLTSAAQSKPEMFVLPGKGIFAQRYEILDRGSVLNRIERALRDADFLKNRAFLSWAIPSINTAEVPIMPMYEEEIDNSWGYIPKEFKRLQSGARRGRWDLEEVVEKLRQIESSRDPEEALNVAEEIEIAWGDSVGIPRNLFDEDFYAAVQEHKKIYNQLVEAGLLGAHAAMRRSIVQRVLADVAPRMPLEQDQVYVLRTRYDPVSFLNLSLDSRFAPAATLWTPRTGEKGDWHYEDMPQTAGLLSARKGMVEVYVAAGRYGYNKVVNGNVVETDDTWGERIKDVAETSAAQTIEAVLKERFGE